MTTVAASGQTLTAHDLGRDEVTGFSDGQWIDLLDERVELAAERGALLQIESIQPERREKVEEPLRRLLIVDDEEAIRFSMHEYFTHHGFSVETAEEVEQAERVIKAGKFEVIIQDLRLGTTKEPDGLTIIRLAHEYCPETRIVVLTAYGSNEVEIEAKASGADAFLRKPQPLSQVAQVVRGLLESPRRWAAPHV